MSSIKTKIRPKISKRAFWDIDFNSIDWEKNSQYLIVRVIERGKFQDLFGIINFYGKERVKNELRTASKLPQRTYDFARAYFALNKDDFQCSIMKL
jgi:hypothetical protein